MKWLWPGPDHLLARIKDNPNLSYAEGGITQSMISS
jgi:hypothetical protein